MLLTTVFLEMRTFLNVKPPFFLLSFSSLCSRLLSTCPLPGSGLVLEGEDTVRKATAFPFSVSFCDPSFEVECPLGLCSCPFIDSSSLSVLSSPLFILALPEWDRSFPVTSAFPYMLIPSLQICVFSLVLRIFSTIKRHYKPSVLKLNLFSHPSSCFCSYSFPSFSLHCCICHFR